MTGKLISYSSYIKFMIANKKGYLHQGMQETVYYHDADQVESDTSYIIHCMEQWQEQGEYEVPQGSPVNLIEKIAEEESTNNSVEHQAPEYFHLDQVSFVGNSGGARKLHLWRLRIDSVDAFSLIAPQAVGQYHSGKYPRPVPPFDLRANQRKDKHKMEEGSQ